MKQHQTVRAALLFLICLTVFLSLFVEKIESQINCYDSISVNSFDSNSVSDLRCSPSTYALSNRRGGFIQGVFNYAPKGKIILGSQFSISLKYLFSSCDSNIKHNSSLLINDQFIMSLPFDASQCSCFNREFALSPNISSYLKLNPTNTLKITSEISTNTEIYISDVSVKFCYVPQTTSIADLKVENNFQSIALLTPESFAQAMSEPFSNILVSKTSNVTDVPYTITNNAIDVVEDLTMTVSLTGIQISKYLVVVANLQKTGPNGQSLTISPTISKTVSDYQISFVMNGVYLQSYEKLTATLTLISIKEDSITSGVNLQVVVNAENSHVVELSQTDNKIEVPFKLYMTKSFLSENEKSAGPIYNAGQVSDLAIFNFQPLVTSPFNPNCWLQLNMIINGQIPTFVGNVYIWSSKTKTQFSMYFTYSNFIGSTLFMAIPTDQLDCNPSSSTKLYMRVETSLPFSYRMYVSRKVYSSVSSLSKSISNIYTPKLEKGEGFAVSIDNLYDPGQDGFEKVPLNFQLSSLNQGDLNTRFNAFLTSRISSPKIFRSRDAVSIPFNPFPNVILGPDNLIYYFEKDCIDCSLSLSLKLPDNIKNPPQILPNSVLNEAQPRNDYGIYWKFVDVSSISSSSTFAVATITVNNVQYQSNKNIKLLATQNRIDSTYSASLRSIQSGQDYSQTTDCSSSSLGNYRITLAAPTNSQSGVVWKFGFFIDPIVMLNSVNFAISQYSSLKYISNTGVTTVETLKVPEFMYSFQFNCASCKTVGKTNILLFSLIAETLQLDNRYYEIFLKIGDAPTTSSYDIKSGYISTKSSANTTQIFKPRFVFSSTGTTVVTNDGSFKLVSPKRLDDVGNTVYLLIKEVPNTIFSTETSCLAKNQSAFFTYQYESVLIANSETVAISLTDNTIFSIDASKMIFNDTNNGKNLLVELGTSANIELNPILIHPVTGMKIVMQKNVLSYRYQNNGFQFQKFTGSIPITRDVLNQVKGATMTVLMIPSNSGKSSSSSIPSLSVTTFVEQDFDWVSYFTPLLISVGVVGGLFVIGVLYLMVCYVLTLFVDFHISLKGRLRGSLTYKSWATYFFMPYIFSVFTPLLVYEGFFKKEYTAKLTPKRVLMLGGSIMLIIGAILIVGLITPMGIYVNNVVNNSNEQVKLKETKTLGNSTHLACCRYSTSSRTFSSFIYLQDNRYLACLKTFQNGYSNLTVNDVPYVTSSNTYEYISNTAIIMAKINCPRSEIIIVNQNVVDANDIGVAGICLGLISLFMGLSQISAPFCKKGVKKIRNFKLSTNRQHTYKASTTASNNATVAQPKTNNAHTASVPISNNNHSSIPANTTNNSTVAITNVTIQSNAQAEFQRREEEIIRNEQLQLEPQAQPYEEIEMPNIPIPNFKLPSVPSQAVGVYSSYHPNDMVLENLTPQIPPPNYESPTTNPQVFIYDSSIAPVAPSNFTSNQTANASDYVVMYQRSDNNNNGSIDNPNNV